jgi:hypothetical protein
MKDEISLKSVLQGGAEGGNQLSRDITDNVQVGVENKQKRKTIIPDSVGDPDPDPDPEPDPDPLVRGTDPAPSHIA